jgi:hypothetical protein
VYPRPATLAYGALLLAAPACTDQEPLTSPRPGDTEVQAEIRDGAHGGNAHFFFLPPLVPAPRASGTSDPSLAASLVAEVCDLGTSRPPATESCGGAPAVIARFSSTSGAGDEVLRYDGTARHYVANWHTDRTVLQISHYYRLRVLAAGTELGQADIDPVKNARDLRNYDTGDLIPLVNGTTLPIRFRVEVGAVVVVAPGSQPQSVAVPSAVAGQAVVVGLPGGTQINGGSTSIGITVEPTPAPAGVGAIAGTAYEFGPDGTTFSQPVTLTVPYDPAALAAVPEAKLGLYRALAGGKLELLPGSTVDPAANTVSGLTDHFSVYVVAEQVAAVDIVQASVTVDIDLTSTLDATVDQAGRVIAWSSSDPSVATVSEDGVVTGVAAGTAQISATSEGQSDQAAVTVPDQLEADYSLSITSLGTLPGGYTVEHVGINPRHTVVVGNASRLDGRTDAEGEPVPTYRVFVYTGSGGLRFLDGEYASADLSDANTERASGYASDDPSEGYQQIVWDLATGAVLRSAPGFGGSINDDNDVVGVCGEPELCGDNPTIRDAGGTLVHVLPPGNAGPVSVARIGEQREVVGTADIGAGTHAVLWTPAEPALQDLTPALGFSAAVGINLGGQVTGHFSDGTAGQGAFVWSESAGLELLPNPFGTSVAPGTVTDEGMVYGQTVFPDDPLRRVIVWTRESGVWVAKVSEKIPAGRRIGNTNNLGQTAAVNEANGELELLTLVP